MHTINARNINDAWSKAKHMLTANYVRCGSRAGDVLRYPEPVTTIYHRPWERVLFDPARDANPFFHLFESLWMLAGRNDTAWVAQFNKRLWDFCNDGVMHGTYGHRWRSYFGLRGGETGDDFTDQLQKIIRMLKKDPNERRAVLTMWDPTEDLDRPEIKDLPCNTHVYFKIRSGALTMTVCNRSNDIVWGCYGANVVHFSMLQEYVATMIGVPIGKYYQVSDDWHAYEDRWEQYTASVPAPPGTVIFVDYYATSDAGWSPFMDKRCSWDDELRRWMENTEHPNLSGDYTYKNAFFPHVAQPLYNAWCHHKEGDFRMACRNVRRSMATDWRIACEQWLVRRQERQEKKGKHKV